MSGPTRERGRVLVLINDLATGGAQRAALDQAAALDRRGWEVELASLDLIAAGPWAMDRIGAIPVHRLSGARGWGSAWRKLERQLDHFRPDVVHAHLMAAALAAALGAGRSGAQCTVVTFHNLTDWCEKRFHPLRLAGRAALGACDAVVAVSEAVRSAIARVDARLAARTTVIPNGVDLATFGGASARRAELRARRDMGDDEFVVGAVARLDRRKGIDLLIDAVALAAPRIPRFRLRVIGDGPERRRLEAQARALGVAGLVDLVGERTQVGDELAAFDLFVAPSRTEGQGVAVIEALAAGVPVIGARVGGIPEVLDHGACGVLVEPESPPALADAIVRLQSSGGERLRLSGAGIERARGCSIDHTAARLEWLYEEHLDARVRRAAA